MSRLALGVLALNAILLIGPGPASARPQDPAPVPAPTTPAKSPGPGLVGEWSWSWKDGEGNPHRHLLVIEGVPPKYAARERFDEMPPVAVTRLVVQDRKVSFTVQRGNRTSTYTGTLADGDTINGEVSVVGDNGQAEKFAWTAQRAPKSTPAKGDTPTPPAEGENPGSTGKTAKP
jgi:hypothetical protein